MTVRAMNQRIWCVMFYLVDVSGHSKLWHIDPMTSLAVRFAVYKVAQKNKRLLNCHDISWKPANEARVFVNFEYEYNQLVLNIFYVT